MDNDSTLYWDASLLPPKWGVWIVVLLAGATIGTIGAVRPKPSICGYGGVPTDAYWEAKYHYADRNCNMLLLGSSRVFKGLDPAVFDEAIPGVHCYNYGFAGLRYSPEYLGYITKIMESRRRSGFSQKGGAKRVLLGLSATNFLLGQEDKFLTLYKSKPPKPLPFLNLNRIHHEEWFTPPVPTRQNNSIQIAHRNGWVASDFRNRNLDLVLERRKDLLSKAPRTIAKTNWAPLIEAVRKWHAQGIAVYAYETPISPKLHALEARQFPLDYASFIAEFEAAGGVWIPVDPASYETYDGNHLTMDSARQISQYLAEQIIKIETAPKPGE